MFQVSMINPEGRVLYTSTADTREQAHQFVALVSGLNALVPPSHHDSVVIEEMES